jgi:HPt (histidine-containing phosphotransfer) domain-containing protein
MTDDVVYIDISDGVKRVMNNEKLYIKLLTKFKDDNNFAALEGAIAAGDMEKAQGAAHTLKGVAANLSLSELFNQCLKLENQIKSREVNPVQMETVKTVFTRTIQEANKVISDHA